MLNLRTSSALSGTIAESLINGFENKNFTVPPHWLSGCVDPRSKPYETMGASHDELHTISSVGGFIGAPSDIAHSVTHEKIATLFLRFGTPKALFVTGHEQCAGVGNLIKMAQGECDFRPYYQGLLTDRQRHAITVGAQLAPNPDDFRDLVAQLMVLVSTKNMLLLNIGPNRTVEKEVAMHGIEVIPAITLISKQRQMAVYDSRSKEFVTGKHLEKLLQERDGDTKEEDHEITLAQLIAENCDEYDASKARQSRILTQLDNGIESFSERIARGEGISIIR